MSKVTDRAQQTSEGVFNTHVREAGSGKGKGTEQIVGAGAVAPDGGPSTAATLADGGPDPAEEDGEYKPGPQEGVEEVPVEEDVVV